MGKQTYDRREHDIVVGEAVVETQLSNDKHDANTDKGDAHAEVGIGLDGLEYRVEICRKGWANEKENRNAKEGRFVYKSAAHAGSGVRE